MNILIVEFFVPWHFEYLNQIILYTNKMSSIDKKTLLGSLHQGATRGKDENESIQGVSVDHCSTFYDVLVE